MTDPASLLQGLRQPDRRSCGASVVVAARMLADPSYAASMTPAGFADAVLVAHRRITARDVAGVPWPRALGTPPWAVARELGPRHVTRLAWPRARASFDRVAASVGAGHLAALYVGNRWCPRHVVLAVAAPAVDSLLVYEPSSGRMAPVDRRSVVEHRMRLAGWDRLWFVVHTR
ncbi:MAG: hypothetical protein Q8O61_08980 [Nocardioides sp.]|nr:hypothetical protein [Nocardioides sp.]